MVLSTVYRNFGKRLLDLLIVVPALLLTMPLMLLIAVLVYLKLGCPLIFRQQRPGWYGRPFTIFKFRTLSQACDAQGNLLSDAERLTRFGQFLRSSSLDELPELFNVLRGEMSLVGPRPLLTEYLDRYSPEQMWRHQVRPGITGLAQVNGRNSISWEEKFKLDIWYVDHLSFWLDVRIIVRTAWKTFKREGISHAGHVTMEEFKGYPAKTS